MGGLYFDSRWFAPHGIGRFATELHKRLTGFQDLKLGGKATQPIDPVRLGRHLNRIGANGYFSPGYNVPLSAKCTSVSTIHDLIHVHFPQGRSWLKTAYYRRLQRPVIRRSPVTLTVSQFSRQQICQWYDIPESQVVCVGNGVSDSFLVDGPVAASDQPYLIYVGNLKPHKNVGVLLDAMTMLRSHPDLRLRMLVPGPNDSCRDELESRGLSSRVEILGRITDEALATHYRGASALVLPSLFEGFGLPLVEAMACGCPVIGADCTSIPEVMGEAGLKFDPNSPEALADAIDRLINDTQLRDQMRDLGIKQVGKFTWNGVARRVQQAIEPYFDIGLSVDTGDALPTVALEPTR